MNFRKKSKRPLIHLLENHVANLLRKTSEKKTDIKVQKCDGLDWMGLVIIGHRSSKSTVGVNYRIIMMKMMLIIMIMMQKRVLRVWSTGKSILLREAFKNVLADFAR